MKEFFNNFLNSFKNNNSYDDTTTNIYESMYQDDDAFIDGLNYTPEEDAMLVAKNSGSSFPIVLPRGGGGNSITIPSGGGGGNSI